MAIYTRYGNEVSIIGTFHIKGNTSTVPEGVRIKYLDPDFDNEERDTCLSSLKADNGADEIIQAAKNAPDLY